MSEFGVLCEVTFYVFHSSCKNKVEAPDFYTKGGFIFRLGLKFLDCG